MDTIAKKSLGQRIRQIREARGVKQYALEFTVGLKKGNLSRIEAGEQEPSTSTLIHIAEELGIKPSELWENWGGLEAAPELKKFKNVPVVGVVQGGDNGFITDLDHPVGFGDGEVMYPATDPNCYALRVRGDSMHPRIKNGQFIVVEPNKEVTPGDDVVVCLKDGRRMVKELLYIRDGEHTFGSINNNHPNITVMAEEIDVIQYVGAILARGAFQPS